MTLIITCKGPEGLALAADSRATITVTTDSGEQGITHVDTATKLFALAGAALCRPAGVGSVLLR